MTKKRFVIYLAIFLIAAVAITAVFFFSAGKILSFPAKSISPSNSINTKDPTKSINSADLIVVLGGDSGLRAPKALELAKSMGHPSATLHSTALMACRTGGAEGIESIKTRVLFLNLTKPPKIFIDNSVAPENIILGIKAKNTWEEAVNVLEFINAYNDADKRGYTTLMHAPNTSSSTDYLNSMHYALCPMRSIDSIIVVSDPYHMLRVRYA